jgi:3-oxoacyl-[acyl-carrier protein] reductase
MKQRKSGHIVAISSLYGAFSRSKRSAYSASKHALNGLVKAMSIELAPDNVLVNTLSPGFVDTKLTRKNNTADMIHEFKEKIPLGRLASVEDISAVAFFLCSEKNTYITGQDIVVDGGYSVGGFQK